MSPSGTKYFTANLLTSEPLSSASRGTYNRGMTTRTVHTVCSHDCPDSCGVLVTIDEAGRATRIQGDPNHPVTRGFLCGKVAKYLDRVYSPDRLLYPMRRRAGVAKTSLPQGREHEAFERITWDEALDVIAARLQQISERVRTRIDPALFLRRHHRRPGIRLDGSPLLPSPRSLAAQPHHLLHCRR